MVDSFMIFLAPPPCMAGMGLFPQVPLSNYGQDCVN
jgi:hypothetical protein